MSTYPWYESAPADEALEQGDFIDNLPVLVPPTSRLSPGDVEVDVVEYDVIVLSQTCDLANDKVEQILVAPVYGLTTWCDTYVKFKHQAEKEKLRQGNYIGLHLLDHCTLEGFRQDFMVVDLKNAISVPSVYIRDFAAQAGRRLRLLPPYREHLNQAYARIYMRVGLPIDIPRFR
jgi:hypothetical protein